MKKRIFFLAITIICFKSVLLSQNLLSKGDHFALINGIRIHYYASGNGPVCLVPTPGWGPSINYLKNSLTPLEKYFTMVYYDTRISGQTTGPKDPTKYTSQDFMNDMDSLRVYLKQPKIWLIGHSMGGFQVLNYGIHHNNRLNGIIAIAPMAGRDSTYFSEFTRMIKKRKGQPYYEKGASIFLGQDTTNYKNSEVMSYIFPFYFHDVNKMVAFEKLGDPGMSDDAGSYTDQSGFGREYLFPELHKITAPTLIVVGDDDFICDKLSQADRIKDRIKSSEQLTISNAGHFCWLEEPTPFFKGVEKWLKKQRNTK